MRKVKIETLRLSQSKMGLLLNLFFEISVDQFQISLKFYATSFITA